jgi:hypothetical protein
MQETVPNLEFIYKTPTKFKSRQYLFAGNNYGVVGDVAGKFSSKVDKKMSLVLSHNYFFHAIQTNLKYRWLEPLLATEDIFECNYIFILWQPEKNKNLTKRYVRFANELLPRIGDKVLWRVFWVETSPNRKKYNRKESEGEYLADKLVSAVNRGTVTRMLDINKPLIDFANTEKIFEQLKYEND